jgi:serine/threonine protein kinase
VRLEGIYKDNLEGLSILLLEDGGVDLHQFVRNVFSTLSITDKEVFLVSITDLIEGVEFFVKHNILHHDIKLANIVYNIQTGKSKIIDFGLMEKINDFIRQAERSDNEMAISWGNFPTELSCANKDDYESDPKCKTYRKIPYNEFIRKVATSFDGYSLSMALVELFMHMFKTSTYNQPFLKEAVRLFLAYTKKDLQIRKTDYGELLKDYRKLLVNHKIVARTPSPTKENVELADTLSVSSLNRSNPKCPSGKPDYNPATKKCMVACKYDKKRNHKFRCVKTKKEKTSNRKTKKNTKEVCSKQGKELNPITGRCLKPCKPGQKRSSKFRCVSNKSEK